MPSPRWSAATSSDRSSEPALAAPPTRHAHHRAPSPGGDDDLLAAGWRVGPGDVGLVVGPRPGLERHRLRDRPAGSPRGRARPHPARPRSAERTARRRSAPTGGGPRRGAAPAGGGPGRRPPRPRSRTARRSTRRCARAPCRRTAVTWGTNPKVSERSSGGRNTPSRSRRSTDVASPRPPTARCRVGVSGRKVDGGPRRRVKGRTEAAAARSTRSASGRSSTRTFTGGTRVRCGGTRSRAPSSHARRRPSTWVATGSGSRRATPRRSRGTS